METTKRRTNPVKINYLVDLAIFAVFLAMLDPRSTGMPVHEWLGIAFGAALMTHLLLHWQWIAATTRRFFGKLPRATRLNYALNGLLFATMTVLIFSGLMISEEALPALGIDLAAGFAWRTLHPLAADAVLILVGLHVALHWKWIVNTTKRYALQPLRSRRVITTPAPNLVEEAQS